MCNVFECERMHWTDNTIGWCANSNICVMCMLHTTRWAQKNSLHAAILCSESESESETVCEWVYGIFLTYPTVSSVRYMNKWTLNAHICVLEKITHSKWPNFNEQRNRLHSSIYTHLSIQSATEKAATANALTVSLSWFDSISFEFHRISKIFHQIHSPIHHNPMRFDFSLSHTVGVHAYVIAHCPNAQCIIVIIHLRNLKSNLNNGSKYAAEIYHHHWGVRWGVVTLWKWLGQVKWHVFLKRRLFFNGKEKFHSLNSISMMRVLTIRRPSKFSLLLISERILLFVSCFGNNHLSKFHVCCFHSPGNDYRMNCNEQCNGMQFHYVKIMVNNGAENGRRSWWLVRNSSNNWNLAVGFFF